MWVVQDTCWHCDAHLGWRWLPDQPLLHYHDNPWPVHFHHCPIHPLPACAARPEVRQCGPQGHGAGELLSLAKAFTLCTMIRLGHVHLASCCCGMLLGWLGMLELTEARCACDEVSCLVHMVLFMCSSKGHWPRLCVSLLHSMTSSCGVCISKLPLACSLVVFYAFFSRAVDTCPSCLC